MTEPATTSPEERTPLPYLPFDTLRNFLDGLNGRPLPPWIDRSLMAGTAGGTQTLLLATLAFFGLIGNSREVLPPFRELVAADVEQRQTVMRQLLHQAYPEAMKLAGQHATADQLAESFRSVSGYQGSTLRKAVTFYLNMAKYAQVEVSPFFRPPTQTPAGRKPTRTRAATSSVKSPTSRAVASDGLVTPTAPAESRSVELQSGGTVTISCSISFLGLSRSDREFVFDLVDRIDGYREALVEGNGAADASDRPSMSTDVVVTKNQQAF